jgi:hypothetical protein
VLETIGGPKTGESFEGAHRRRMAVLAPPGTMPDRGKMMKTRQIGEKVRDKKDKIDKKVRDTRQNPPSPIHHLPSPTPSYFIAHVKLFINPA